MRRRERGSMSRQPRTKRRESVRVVLTERDVALLAALARFGIARSEHLRPLFFAERHQDVFADRARKLFDAGYLDVSVSNLSERNVYSLGPRGREWAISEGLTPVRPPHGQRTHWLGIVRTWCQMASSVHGLRTVTLTQFVPEWELRSTLGKSTSTIVPDALAELTVDNEGGKSQTFRLVVEVDCSTEKAKTLRRKIQNYRRILVSGDVPFGWSTFGLGFAVLGWSTTRKNGLTELLDRSLPTWWLIWDLDEGPERALKGLSSQAHPPVTDSRCGNGSPDSVSAGIIDTKSAEEGGL